MLYALDCALEQWLKVHVRVPYHALEIELVIPKVHSLINKDEWKDKTHKHPSARHYYFSFEWLFLSRRPSHSFEHYNSRILEKLHKLHKWFSREERHPLDRGVVVEGKQFCERPLLIRRLHIAKIQQKLQF